jgi:methyl-accepting chemotaxis protein
MFVLSMVSIRFKVLLLLGMSIGIYAVIVVGITTKLASSYLVSQAKVRLMDTVNATETSIELSDNFVEKPVDAIADMVSSTIDVKTTLANPKVYAQRYLDSIGPVVHRITENTKGVTGGYVYLNVDLYKGIYDLYYNLQDGKIVQNFEQEDISTFYPTNDDMTWYYAPILGKKPVWTHIYYDALIKETMFSYVRPIFVGDVLVGMVGFDEGFTDIENKVQALKFFDSGYAVLLDENGKFIVKPKSGDVLSDSDIKLVMAALKKNKKGILEMGADYCGYSEMNNGQTLVVVVPKTDVYRPVANTLPGLIAVLVGLAIVVAVAGTIFSRTITNPIKQLEKFANGLRDGVFDKKIEIKSRDEVGKLAETFENLRISINEKNGELAAVNENLEQKVVERTGELLRKNEELKKINNFTLGREVRMVELKKEIDELRKKVEG